MSYSPLLLEHFRHPQYTGKLAPGPGVFVAEVHIPSGDQVKLAIATENACIKDLRYQVFGCPAMIACMSWMSTELIHKDYLQATKLNASKINQALSLPSPKFRCALLAEQVLEKVLDEWYNVR